MENSTKKSGGGVLPKKKRSLDINSLYEPRVPVGGEVKKRDSEKNRVEDVEMRRKKGRKEVSLSSLKSEGKRGKEEDVSGEKSEKEGDVKKSIGANADLHGTLQDLAGNTAVFNVPKRPRGFVGRKRTESEHSPKPLRLQDPQLPKPIKVADQPIRSQDSNDRVTLGNVDVTKSKIGRGVKDKLINASSISAAKGGTPELKSPGRRGRKKLESDRLSKPSVHQGSVDSMVPVNVDASKPRAAPRPNELDKVAISAGGGDVKGLYSPGKNKQPNSQLKQKAELKSPFVANNSNQILKHKADLKSTVEASCSKMNPKQHEYVDLTIVDTSRTDQIVQQKTFLKSTLLASSPRRTLKRKAGGDEAKESKNTKSDLVEKEENVFVSGGNRSPKRQRSSNSQKKVLSRSDVAELLSNSIRESKTGVAVGEEIVGVNNGNCAPVKHRRKSKKKDIEGGSDVKVTSKKKVGTSVGEVIKSKNDRHVTIDGEEYVFEPNPHTFPELHQSGSMKQNDSFVGGSDVKVTSKKKAGTSVGEAVKSKNDMHVTSDGKEYVLEAHKRTFPDLQQSGSMKQNDSFVGGVGEENSNKKTGPSVDAPASDNLFVDFLDDDDDDEENLERNAARMLSSRFDPNCTGFPSKKRTSKAVTVDVSSVPVSSGKDFCNQQANTSVFHESGSGDAKNIALRPRGDDKGKPVQRKRRHFYEVLPQDFDASWVVNRRIKVFWPLDESWYDGLVKGYHPEVKLHHIKYDDRDEEWVDLQEETFKLLLLPNEVPGKVKGRKRKVRSNDAADVRTAPRSANDNHTGNELDSEPISSWLARPNQRAKFSPSLKKTGTSPLNLPMTSSLSAEKTENSHSLGNMSDSVTAINSQAFESALVDGFDVEEGYIESMLGAPGRSSNDMQIVYVRKRKQGHSSASIDANKASIDDNSLSPVDGLDGGCVDSEQLWLIDCEGKLQLNIMLVASAEFRFQTCLAALPFLELSHEAGDYWLLHRIFMLHHGTLVTASPAVKLEMLFVDSNYGLRFLLFEGCLKQGLDFFFLILAVFSKSSEQWNGDTSVPVTSIRFRVLAGEDSRKHHVFSFYSFSGLKRSKWLYLESKLLQHCILLKQLPISECTHDNFKELESGNLSQRGSDSSESSAYKDNRNSATGILPMGICREACNARMSLSSSSLVASPGEVSQSALCFGTAQTFLLNLHLQSIMEPSITASINLQQHDAMGSIDHSESCGSPVGETHTCTGPPSGNADDIAPEETNLNSVQGSEMDLVLARNSTGDSSLNLQNIPEVFASGNDLEVSAQLEHDESVKDIEEHDVASSLQDAPACIDPISNPRCDLKADSLVVDIPPSDMVLDGKGRISSQTPVAGSVKYGFINSPRLIGSRSPSKRRISSSISALGDLSPMWSDGKTNSLRNAFSNGPKKPRTQVRYTMPTVGYDVGARHKMQNQTALPCKRIRRASLKRLSDVSREVVVKDASKSNQKKSESLSCGGNVLVTQGDKGWRVCGVTVVLEVSDRNEWRLAVKLAGVTKYSYKVNQILQPGTTNRFSHAMMWKGGKDWALEFPDRSQWTLFKEMHEECHNRNIRAASVKNIPIPGVRLVEENDDWTEVPFVRHSMKYLRQVQADAEMALDPSRVLYDMDSDDERWLLTTNRGRDEELSEEALEKAMDMFEKVSCLQQRNNFTDAEIEEILVGVSSMEAAKLIYEHWRHKREKKGMPLIRHLQPPLWERYQQQLKEWERTVGRANGASNASQGKAAPPEKPPMFAFCMKPRGLEVPNRGSKSKQRSQRKFLVSGHHHASSRYPEGRRSNGHAYRDDKVLYPLHEYSDLSPAWLNSDASEWSHNPNIYKNRPKKLKSFAYLNSQHNQRTATSRAAVQQWNAGLPEMSSQRQAYLGGNKRRGMEKLKTSDVLEFRLRDASSASKHAHNMAKLKRDRAQRLLYRADLCIHKAVTAIMTAEAMRAAHGVSNAKS